MNKLTDKLYNWASILDDVTKEQAKITSSMPFIHHHMALMPDAHLGKGATVGSVIPTIGAIILYLRVDKGCSIIKIWLMKLKKDILIKSMLMLQQYNVLVAVA